MRAIRRIPGQQHGFTHPIGEPEDKTRKPDRRSGQQRRRCRDEAPLEALDLKQVLPNGTDLDVVFVRFTDPAEEVNGVRVAQIPVNGLEDIALGLKDLGFRVRGVRTVEEVGRGGSDNLLHLRGNEHARDPHELQLREGNHTRGEEAVNDVNTEEQGLWQEAETRVDLDEPVGQDATHFPGEVLLVGHVVRVRHRRLL